MTGPIIPAGPWTQGDPPMGDRRRYDTLKIESRIGDTLTITRLHKLAAGQPAAPPVPAVPWPGDIEE